MDFTFDPSRLSKATAEDYSTSDSDSESENDANYPNPADDDDYSEFKPRKRRRTGRNGKESAALGIFGSESDDDYAGRNNRRGKRRQPLHQQHVSFVSSGTQVQDGNEDDDDNGEDSSDARRSARGSNGDLGYSPLSRKRKGLRQGDEDEDDEGDDGDHDYDGKDFGGAGLGFGGIPVPTNDMGFVPSSFNSSRQQRYQAPPPQASTIAANNPLGSGFVPSSAYDPVLNEDAQATSRPRPVVARPSAFSRGISRGGGGGSPNPNSFGARMMAKMGYVEGKGLGKEGHGRNIIIEANLRPQGAGLGAVREKSEKERQEEKRQARLRGEVVEDSEEEERKIKAKAAARRKKAAGLGGGSGASSGPGTPRRPKTKYLTLEEVKKAAPGLHIPAALTSILDLTGPNRKMLASASGLMTPTGAAPGTPGPVLATEETAEQTASRKAMRRAQAEFMAILEEWQSLQNRKAFTDLQAQQEKQELAELELDLQSQTYILHAFEKLRQPLEDSQADGNRNTEGDGQPWRRPWDHTIAQLKVAAEAIPPASLADMKDVVASISVAALFPLFKKAMEAWEPLKDPNTHLAEGLQSISHVLGMGKEGIAPPLNKDSQEQELHYRGGRYSKKSVATPYETMVYKLWLPHMSAAVRQWDAVHDPDSILAVFEAWRLVLPDFVRLQLLEHDIVRKLDEAVAKWEPKRQRHQNQTRSLPHLWLFPWLPYLPSRHLDPRSADGLVAEVKRKFRQLVDVWEYYRGVVPGLRQWKSVLRPRSLVGVSNGAGGGHDLSKHKNAKDDQWRPLIMSHVLPSMARYVRTQFRVDPHDQAPYLEVITGEFQWLLEDLLAADLISEVMVAEVFPMWHEALYQLLTVPAGGPNSVTVDQLAQWLQWWAEEVFPPAIQRLPSVVAEFERGLTMINEALDLCCKDGDGRVAYDADQVRAGLARPRKGPALVVASSLQSQNGRHHHGSSHHPRDLHNHHRLHNDTAPALGASAQEPEEMTIRHYVEDWCENNDLQFMPERKKVHAEGPLYRITARGDGKGGVLVYFKGVRLYVETKKGPVEIRVDREEDWTKLLGMAS